MAGMAEVWEELAEQCSGPCASDDESTGHTCRRCQDTYQLGDGCEPTGLCNNCAQAICLEVVPLLLKRIADVGKLLGNEGCSCIDKETGEGANHEDDLYSCEGDGHEPCFAHLVERALFGDKGLVAPGAAPLNT